MHGCALSRLPPLCLPILAFADKKSGRTSHSSLGIRTEKTLGVLVCYNVNTFSSHARNAGGVDSPVTYKTNPSSRIGRLYCSIEPGVSREPVDNVHLRIRHLAAWVVDALGLAHLARCIAHGWR